MKPDHDLIGCGLHTNLFPKLTPKLYLGYLGGHIALRVNLFYFLKKASMVAFTASADSTIQGPCA